MRWRCVKLFEQVQELQKALSDANVYLYDEREQVIRLQAENEQLKMQEIEVNIPENAMGYPDYSSA